TYAQMFAMGHPTHKVSVVLITDGIPNECTGMTAADTAAVAAMFFNGTPSVKTYVISIANDNTAAEWNSIAAAGGTGTAYPTLSQVDIQNALNSVRAAATMCP